MQFVNNWTATVELAGDATEMALPLADGNYVLTITDSERSQHEIIGAEIWDGTAYLDRGREGTTARAWPAGSVVYQSITAETMTSVMRRLADLEEQVVSLTPLAPGQLISGGDTAYATGYAAAGVSSVGELGRIGAGTSVIPDAVAAPGDPGEVIFLVYYAPYGLEIKFRGQHPSAPTPPFSTLQINGQHNFHVSDATIYNPAGEVVTMSWPPEFNPLPPGLKIHNLWFMPYLGDT